MTFNGLSNNVQGRGRERAFWSVVPKRLDTIAIISIVFSNEGAMSLLIVVINKFFEPEGVGMSIGQ